MRRPEAISITPPRPAPEQLPRCEQLDGSTLRIVPAYTEAGRLCEANCITVTDGERTCVYVPLKVADPEPMDAETGRILNGDPTAKNPPRGLLS